MSAPRPIYVLGAGFSRNFSAQSYPLVREFLSRAKEKHYYDPEGKHRQLAFIISTYFGNPLYPDIEKILSFLSSPQVDYHPHTSLEGRSTAYDELVELIVGFLSDASESEPDSQSIGETYKEFAQHLIHTESIVISFNYDLLLEDLLLSTGGWGMYDGYGVNLPLTYDALPTLPRGDVPKTYFDQSLERPSKVTLLKLHGSINWGIPIIAADLDNTIYRLTTVDMNSIAHNPIGPHPKIQAPLTMFFKPVIVPPVFDKSSWLKNLTFRFLWGMALEALLTAEEITFVGYSLPTTDFMAEFLFRQGINRHSIERKITIVAPRASKELRTRYQDVFGSIASTVDISFKDSDFVSYANESLFSR